MKLPQTPGRAESEVVGSPLPNNGLRLLYPIPGIADWAEMFKRCYETAGLTNMDRVHVTRIMGSGCGIGQTGDVGDGYPDGAGQYG